MTNRNEIKYTMYPTDNGAEPTESYPLSATTDAGARRVARSEAKRIGCRSYVIRFWRASDQCCGQIDN